MWFNKCTRDFSGKHKILFFVITKITNSIYLFFQCLPQGSEHLNARLCGNIYQAQLISGKPHSFLQQAHIHATTLEHQLKYEGTERNCQKIDAL